MRAIEVAFWPCIRLTSNAKPSARAPAAAVSVVWLALLSCWVHGLAAKQVRQKQEQRILVAELEAKAAQTVVVRREPEELLLDALHDTNAVLTRIKADLHDGVVNPILLELAGDWLDRLGRLGKVVVDGDLSEKLHRRLGWLAEDRGQQLSGVLVATLRAADVSARERLLLWNAVEPALRAIRDEREPLRLTGDGVRRFTDELLRAADAEQVAEQPAVEGFSWADPDPDSPDELGTPSLFSSSGSGAL